MKTIEIQLFKFSELSEDAQKKAIEKLSDINVDYDWWEVICEDAENIGLKITEFDLYRMSIDGNFNLSAAEVAHNIMNELGVMCETYKTAETFLNEFNPVFAEYMETEEGEDKLIDLESDFLNSLLEDYRIMLQKDFDYLTSEEAIIETIEANDYDFTANGELY